MMIALAVWDIFWICGMAIAAMAIGIVVGVAIGMRMASSNASETIVADPVCGVSAVPAAPFVGLYLMSSREPSGSQTWPCGESQLHLFDEADSDCPCNPMVQWIDEETGLPFENGPIVLHNHLRERSNGAG